MEMDLDRRGEDDKMGADSLTDEEVRRPGRKRVGDLRGLGLGLGDPARPEADTGSASVSVTASVSAPATVSVSAPPPAYNPE